MPRRNLTLIVGLTVLCYMCAVRASRQSRILDYAMDQIRRRYVETVDRRELFEGALAGMMDTLDDYSEYISPADSLEFQENLDKKFGGVGIQIVPDPHTDRITVVRPLVGTPAYEAGILPGDKILRIDGQSTQGLSLEDAAARMKGEPGTPVTLTVRHEGDEEPVDVEIVRAEIPVKTVLGDTRNADDTWNYFLEGHDRIGYLRVNSFGEATARELAKALRWLAKRDAQGLILDLRENGGGMLGAAVGVCDLFVSSGVIVTTRGRDRERRYMATNNGTYSDVPMAVLVNGASASASEIVAACLQDHGRAVIVGERTYGKGSVQEIVELKPGYGILKLTTASYWRPSEKNIQRRRDHDENDEWGVTPNPGYTVKIDVDERSRLYMARFRRDVARATGEPAPDGQPAPYVDPQVAKAVEYIEKVLGR
ncbi:MAG: S41 family peptidase [Planctomycetota bacterium]|jgi:carboxyl-terminal processing protease